MKPAYERDGTTIYHGDALAVLRELPAQSVNCCVTSPPYWGLRDYGVSGQLGLEKTPDEYVAKMVDVFREVRRVLMDDATLWLNLGDSYATGGGAVGRCPGGGDQGERFLRMGHINTQPNRMPIEGLKPKDLIGIPWRVALALQADSWWLRQDIIWHKPNPMPESVTDRCTKAHEYIFLMAKSERYHYDQDAIQEPLSESSESRYAYAFGGSKSEALVQANVDGIGTRTRVVGERTLPSGRNRRSVWTVNPASYPGAHFATFPPKLIEPCILAGCPAGGVVLDPFLGSGTTAAVAQRLGCKCVGIELNEAYIRLATKRLKQGVLELTG